ncbi:MAG: hypothetical protein KJO11_13955 [Gemmatimonadetes bacterium]|nr:hypothetical protein [Gemmatimonadota bacterium]NNK62299.1 hypothetical protein [Gemmatimonadota bacterium]
MHLRTFARSAVLAAAVSLAVAPARAAAQSDLLTPAERSGFTAYTPYADMMEYLEALRSTSPEMWLGTYGTTHQGRDLPYAVFSRPSVSTPAEAWALGRPIITLNANVHGGERTLRESVLILMREFVTPGTEAHRLLDDLVVVVAPQINPDGFEATERGTRGNSWGIDMNRDWVKREQPALTAYGMNVVDEWTPHILVDGHNGGAFPYHITYQCPSHAEPDQRLTQMCDEGIFPEIDRRVDAIGYKSWFYARGTETRWNGGGYDARIGRNYSGFINTIGILFESPGWQEMESGVPAGLEAFKAVLGYAAENADAVLETVARARRETIEMGQQARGDVVVAMEYAPQPRTVTYEIGVRDDEDEDPRIVEVTNDSLMTRPVATKTRPRPYAYVLPRDAVDAVALLRRNSISVEVLTRPMELELDAYVVEGVEFERAYNHAAAVRLELADDVVSRTETLPAGTYVVRTGQMRGRLAAHMLEPETNDNVIYWNTMDAWLPLRAVLGGESEEPALAPIWKLMQPTGLPLRLVN